MEDSLGRIIELNLMKSFSERGHCTAENGSRNPYMGILLETGGRFFWRQIKTRRRFTSKAFIRDLNKITLNVWRMQRRSRAKSKVVDLQNVYVSKGSMRKSCSDIWELDGRC